MEFYSYSYTYTSLYLYNIIFVAICTEFYYIDILHHTNQWIRRCMMRSMCRISTQDVVYYKISIIVFMKN